MTAAARIDGTNAVCGRCRRPLATNERFCGACGAPRSTRPHPLPPPPGSRPGPAWARPPRTPGTVVAACVLLGLDAASTVLLGLVAMAASAFVGRLSPDDGASGPQALLTLVAVMMMVFAVVEVVLLAQLAKGRAGARRGVTVLLGVDFVLGVVLTAFDAISPLRLVGGLLWSALVVGLLWLPASSVRHFSPAPRHQDDAPTVPLRRGPTGGAPPSHGRQPGYGAPVPPRPAGAPGRSTLAVVLGVVGVGVLLIVGVVAVRDVAATPSMSLTACSDHFVDEWGPGLASESGEHITRAVVGVAITNSSFDTPTDIPRHFLEQAYQTQDEQGHNLTVLADRHMREALGDSVFASCHDQYEDLGGRTDQVLRMFDCREVSSGPFRVDCDD